MIQTVDLAAKFSAVILRERSGEVLGQFDSRGLSPFAFAARIGRNARECELTLVEGLPYGLQQLGMILPPARFQGLVMMACNQTLDDLRFIDPSRWMRGFAGVKELEKHEKDELAAMGLSKAQLKAQTQIRREANMLRHAAEAGYTPPDLVQQYIDANPGKKILKKDTNPLVKNTTDYVAAFLIGQFALRYTKDELFALQGVDFPMI